MSANGHENNEDLFLFTEMQQRERAAIHDSIALTPVLSPKSAGEDIFSSFECDKHDYDWLMTPPVTPFLSSREQNAPIGNGFSLDGSVTVKNALTPIAKVGSSKSDPRRAQAACRSFHIHKPADPNVALATSTSTVSRKSLSAATRSSTPSRSSSSISRPSARSSTPSKSVPSSASVSSSTPTGQAASPSNRSVSSTRPLMPIKRPATPSRVNGPSPALLKPSSVNMTSSLSAKSVSSMHPSCPATRVRLPATHSVALSEASQESRPNLRSSAADRPLSNPRGSVTLKYNASTAAPKAAQLQSADAGSHNRGSSRSPMVTRGRVSSDSLDREKSSLRRGKLQDASMISMSHGVGSKMVGKSIPPRKPLPLSQEKTHFVVNTPAKKTVQPTPPRERKLTSLAQQSSGFGRNLSKKSLEMALRHMDIQGSTANGAQSFMSNVPTSSLYSVRSRNSRGISNGRGTQTSSITSAPMTTSSNASSEHSMSIVIDPESSERDDETSSSRASPLSQPDPSMTMSNKRKVSCWLGSPGYMGDNGADIMKNFEQELASVSGTESPLVGQPEGNIVWDDFTLEPV